MAEGRSVIKRIVSLFDRASAKKAESEMVESLGKAGGEGGKKSGDNFVRELRDAFAKRKAQLSEQLARGTIDQKEFKKQTDIAARTFNTGLLKGIEEARRRGEMTDREYIKLTRSIKRVGDAGEKDIGGRLVGALKRAALAAAALFAFHRVQRFTAEIIKLGIDGAETANKFQVTFGEATSQMDEFVASWGKMAGLSRDAARSMLADTGAIAQGMGATRQESADLTEAVGRLAGDLTSLKNVPIEQSLDAINGLLVGQTMRMRTLGIVVTQEEIKAHALAKAGHDNANALTQQQKATAALEIAYRKAGPAIGDLERTQDSQANTLRRLRGQWDTFRQTLGAAIVSAEPASDAMSALSDALATGIQFVEQHGEAIGRWTKIVLTSTLAIARTLTNTAQIIFGGVSTTVHALGVLVNGAMLALTATVNGALRLVNRGIDQLNKIPGVDIDFRLGQLPVDQFHDGLSRSIDGVRDGVRGLGRDLNDIDEAWRAVGRAATAAATAQEEAAHPEGGIVGPDAPGEVDQKELDRLQKLEEQREALIQQMARDIEVHGRRVQAYQEGEEAVEALNRQLHIEEALLRSGAEAGSEFADTIAHLAAAQYDAAQASAEAAAQFESSWTNAAEAVEAQFQGLMASAGALFISLATGGIQSVARLAKVKALENVAAAIENFARSKGWIALGNVPSAAAAVGAAKQHLIAAAKWGAVGGAAGAGGGGGGGGAGGVGVSGPGQNQAPRVPVGAHPGASAEALLAKMGPPPPNLSPEAAVVTDYWRRFVTIAVADGRDRGVDI